MRKTLREAPKDETAKNGALLTRAGYIHKEMAGVYDFLPLGLRVLENIKGIIREELNAIGSEEVLMSALQTFRLQLPKSTTELLLLLHSCVMLYQMLM